jgi:SAM-dependent methyltransferase
MLRPSPAPRLVRTVAALIVGAVAVGTAVPAGQTQTPAAEAPARRPDIHWVPTPDPIVEGMLDLAKVTANDLVYDLGSGDGKIVIAAARRGARGVGIDIDPQRIREGNANAQKAGVADRVQFILGDIFDPNVKIGDATVVTLYLLQSLNIKLMPRLKGELKPGTRIVSHAFSMGTSWDPDQISTVGATRIFLWTVR